MNKIPFNTPFLTGKEVDCINDAYANGQLAGDGNTGVLRSASVLMQVKQVAHTFMYCVKWRPFF